jgi:hypothetical protein
MKQISLRLPEELLELIDGARGAVPRERWLRSVISAEVAMAPRKITEPRRVIDTTLEAGQISLAPARRPVHQVAPEIPPGAPACQHSWRRVDGQSICKHCGVVFSRASVQP